jgi:hypothetical protein
MMAATVFLVLLARYFLGDWVLQSDWQATTRPAPGLPWHMCQLPLVVGLLVLIPMPRPRRFFPPE